MAHEIQFNSTKLQQAVSFLLELLDTKLFVNVTVKQLMEGKEFIFLFIKF
jgi:hypothetical protein